MHCGKELNDGTVFCTDCGNRISPLEPPEAAQIDAPEPTCDPVMSQCTDMSLTEAAHIDAPEPTCDPVMSQCAGMSLTNEAQPIMSAPAAASPMAVQSETAQPSPNYSMPYRGVFPEAEPIEPALSKAYLKNRKAVSSMYSESTRVNTFLNTGLGFILIFVLLGTTAILGAATPMFFDYMNLMNVIKQCGIYALVAMAVVLSMRAKGIDLSIGPMMGMSAAIISQSMLMGSPLLNGLLLVAAAALILGLINGFAASFLKAPAVILTLVSGIVVGGVSLALTQGQILAVAFSGRVQAYAGESPIGVLVLLGAVFVFTYLYNLLSRTGRPMYERGKERMLISYIFAYVASAEIAAAAGFVLLVRLQTAMPALGMGYEAYIVFVFALLMASRALDNRFVPALIALIPAVIWGVLTNIFALWGVITYYQPVVYGGLALICLAVAFICRYEKPMEEHAEK
jgi:ribose/xylose/arabinose/galactoside ABC-type transport system permease subunit/uncharacterized Zn finger protein (UPF0148 family)